MKNIDFKINFFYIFLPYMPTIMDYNNESLKLHKEKRGKLEIKSKVKIETKDDLSVAYTPWVAEVSRYIAENKQRAYEYTFKGNSVAIVSDGSAVLGLGNIGPEGALPVMEGKAILFKEFAGIDGVPIVLDTQDPDEIINIVKNIAPTFWGINLEDIAAPKCFEIEEKLQDIGIPVFHDDQHWTAIVLLAAMLNACKVANKKIEELKVVIVGGGAAGTAIAKLLRCVGQDPEVCIPVKDILVCDSKGIISRERTDLNTSKQALLAYTNKNNKTGTLKDAIKWADCFIGVSAPNLLTAEDIKTMNTNPFIFAMANPTPEIMPEEAKKWGALIIGTGRSDFPNQINNVLAFPGIFRGALDAKTKIITPKMKIAAAHALANYLEYPTADEILPSPLDKNIATVIAEAVKNAK